VSLIPSFYLSFETLSTMVKQPTLWLSSSMLEDLKRQWNSKIFTKKDYDNGFDSNKLLGIGLIDNNE
jgi:hypothetical protein